MKYQNQTIQTHAIKTQLYRWYTLYEREQNEIRVSNQVKILSDDIVISSASGEVKGKKAYTQFVKVYEGWKNAHQLESFEVNNQSIDATIIFQSIKPDGHKSQTRIAYNIALEEIPNGLPLLQQIQIKPIEQQELVTFKDTYPHNRVMALMHYWLCHIERMDGNPEPFIYVLAKDFELHFSKDNVVTTIDAFEKWVKKSAQAVKSTNHFPENILVNCISDNLFELNVEFIWRGTSNEGQALQAHTVHKWIIEDNVNDLFAKIKKMEVAYKIPFSPIKSSN